MGIKDINVDLPHLSVDILLSYEDRIFERGAVAVTAAGLVYPPNGTSEVFSCIGHTKEFHPQECGHNIIIGFEGARPYNESDPEASRGGEFLLRLDKSDADVFHVISYTNNDMISEGENTSTTFTRLPIYQTITWGTQGDYYPYITVFFKDNSAIRVAYPDYKIHVNGLEIKKQEDYSKINLSLTIVLLFFTWVTGMKLLFDLMPEKIYNLIGLECESKKQRR